MKNVKESITSLHVPERVEISGFDAADDSVHMIEWLRKGPDFRQFIVNDIEEELYGQDHEAQLLSVNCKSKPQYETKARSDSYGRNSLVTQFSVTFPLSLRVRASGGAVWDLGVQHSYLATSLDKPEDFRLRLDFTIVEHQIEKQATSVANTPVS